jgi:hypothetical protein
MRTILLERTAVDENGELSRLKAGNEELTLRRRRSGVDVTSINAGLPEVLSQVSYVREVNAKHQCRLSVRCMANMRGWTLFGDDGDEPALSSHVFSTSSLMDSVLMTWARLLAWKSPERELTVTALRSMAALTVVKRTVESHWSLIIDKKSWWYTICSNTDPSASPSCRLKVAETPIIGILCVGAAACVCSAGTASGEVIAGSKRASRRR